MRDPKGAPGSGDGSASRSGSRGGNRPKNDSDEFFILVMVVAVGVIAVLLLVAELVRIFAG